MSTNTDRAAVQRGEQLRERQRAQRTMLGRVNNALLRVQAAGARAQLEEQIAQQAQELAASRAALRSLTASQRAQSWGRGIASLPAEELAAAVAVAEAVEAFGSQRHAAESLGLSPRVIADYLALLRKRDEA